MNATLQQSLTDADPSSTSRGPQGTGEEGLPGEAPGLRARLWDLADYIAGVRLQRRSHLSATKADEASFHLAPRPGTVEIDSEFDLAWSDPDPQFSSVIHAFHLEWHGIRAAAGYFPGSKVGFTANRELSLKEIKAIAAHCGRPGVRAIFFHAISENMVDVIRGVRRVTGDGVKFILVWHGSTAQFYAPVERDGFSRALELRRTGVVDVLVCVKPEMEVLSPLIHRETLLNLPPTLERRPSSRASSGGVFIPMPADWWKNPHTNVIAAACTPSVRRIYSCADLAQPAAFALTAPIEVLGRLRRDEVFRVFSRVDVVLNVSLAECQPMTALESLAHGVPCLTGVLSLGALDSHPYQRLVQIPGTGSLRAISMVLERVLLMSRGHECELDEMLVDYRKCVTALAKERLGSLVWS